MVPFHRRDLAPFGALLGGVLLLHGCGSSSDSGNTATPLPGGAPAPASAPASAPAAKAPDVPAPVRKPPAGMGNAIGRVLWNGKAAPGVEVQLCRDISFIGGCEGSGFSARTDKDGYYIIDKVKPGDYALAIRIFNSNKFIYPTSGIMSAKKFTVASDQTLSIPVEELWKIDLQTTSPKNGETIKIAKPKFAWKAYPGATSYRVALLTKDGGTTVTELKTSEPSAECDKALLNGDYKWRVEATNAEGTKISETPDDSIFKVTGQSGSNKVELISPKSNTSVSGANLTLQWKKHPAAQSYRLYLKGAKAKDPIVSFETMTATSYKVASALPADDYYWTVEAYSGTDKLAASDFTHFTVK